MWEWRVNWNVYGEIFVWLSTYRWLLRLRLLLICIIICGIIHVNSWRCSGCCMSTIYNGLIWQMIIFGIYWFGRGWFCHDIEVFVCLFVLRWVSRPAAGSDWLVFVSICCFFYVYAKLSLRVAKGDERKANLNFKTCNETHKNRMRVSCVYLHFATRRYLFVNLMNFNFSPLECIKRSN